MAKATKILEKPYVQDYYLDPHSVLGIGFKTWNVKVDDVDNVFMTKREAEKFIKDKTRGLSKNIKWNKPDYDEKKEIREFEAKRKKKRLFEV